MQNLDRFVKLFAFYGIQGLGKKINFRCRQAFKDVTTFAEIIKPASQTGGVGDAPAEVVL